MRVHVLCAAIVAGVLTSTVVLADETADAATTPLTRTPLLDVLESVRRQSGIKFVVDSRADPGIVTGQLRAAEIDYPMLLVVLRHNGLAAVRTGEISNVVPVATIRQFPLPVLLEDDDTIDDEEWVTRVVRVEHAHATQLVPILRPLLPKQGHLVAHPDSNTMTIVDRYGNVRRVVELIRKYDYETSQRSQ